MIEPELSQPRVEAANPPVAGQPSRPPGQIRRLLRWSFTALKLFGQFLLITWAALAIYYSNLPWPWVRLLLAAAFGSFAICALWIIRCRKWRWAFAGVFAAVVIWWICILPSNDRPWRPEVGRPPRAIIDGDRVRLLNFRNFVYRSRDDFDVRYEQREVSLSHLVSVDLFVSYWQIGPVAHTFVSFNFDDGSPPVCISIETRPEVGEGFNPLASMFKQFELIYVVGDEHDIVRVRTDHRDEDVFLYRIRATPERVRQLFRIYLDRINQLADQPEWYHLLSNNCTLNIIRYSRAAGGQHDRFDIRHLLNGFIDRYVYGLGITNTSMSFEELRRRSHINEVARAAGNAEDFSRQIRKSLPAPGGD
jgi:hypothetical protein